jgi:hypothetical protein
MKMLVKTYLRIYFYVDVMIGVSEAGPLVHIYNIYKIMPRDSVYKTIFSFSQLFIRQWPRV